MVSSTTFTGQGGKQTESPLVRCSEAGNKGDSLGVACYRKVLRTLRTKWRLRGLKAKVEGKVGEMLRGPGGVLGCCGKADRLMESSWQLGGAGSGVES